mmetsp:Transcript_55643/g.92556  ORF Transcript_55643/g.92556 Transcript_55643/m.92556 type:complete len:662 (+) Transcript_55643:59-2044(+)
MTSNVNSVDSDDDALMWANQDGNQDDGDAQTDNDQSQLKFVWQWRENDGSWHDYDGGSQALLEQMQIGAHIQITAGKWTYDIVKNAADQCTQTNTSTNASRACRRYQQSAVASSSTAITGTISSTEKSTQEQLQLRRFRDIRKLRKKLRNISMVEQQAKNGLKLKPDQQQQLTNKVEYERQLQELQQAFARNTPAIPIDDIVKHDNDGAQGACNGRYLMMWQFLENDNKWKDLGTPIASKLEQLQINTKLKYAFGQFTYTVKKMSADECLQKNEQTRNQRDLRRILYDAHPSVQKRVVWRFKDDKGKWSAVDSNALMLKLVQLSVGDSTRHTRGQWTYVISKIDAGTATQRNEQTQKVRQFKLAHTNRDAMDANWTSNARSSNPNYQAAAASAAAQLLRHAQQHLRQQLATNNNNGVSQNDDDANEDIIVLDPDDVQEIIIADDLRQLNRDDQHDAQWHADDDDDDNKSAQDDIQPERVTMTDEDKAVLTEFHKTMTSDSVQVLSVRKIKDNASKSIVYNALLNVAQIERVLFHGTSAANVAKIVNSGFNRDFNRHHLYGRGTYFSSLASESAKYCENDDSNKDDDDNADNGKFVMLVCRVIVGEFVQGTRKMDGASMPYKPDKKTQFESLVNDVQRPTIFVINRDYHAIPTHIITFKYRN